MNFNELVRIMESSIDYARNHFSSDVFVDFKNKNLAQKVVDESLKKGLILFYFLFNETSVRITPPLNISKKEIIYGCNIIKEVLKN